MKARTPTCCWFVLSLIATVLFTPTVPVRAMPSTVLVGMAWIDENCNGIRETGEPPLLHLPVYLFAAGADGIVSTPDDQVIGLSSSYTTGQFAFTTGASGINYRLTVRDRDRPLGFVPAPYQQGDDRTMDNDLTLPDPNNPYYWSTGAFQLDAEQTTTGIDLGFCRVPVQRLYLPLIQRS